MTVIVFEDGGKFHLRMPGGKICEVSFDDRQDAFYMSHYLNERFREGQEEVRFTLRQVMGINDDT